MHVGRRAAALALAALVALTGCRGEDGPTLRKTHLVKLTRDWRKGRIAVADDGSDAAFIARWPDGMQVVGRNGGGPMYSQCALPEFSPAGRLFYWALDSSGPSDQVFLVVDGSPVLTGFEEHGRLAFSGDGARWAAVGATSDGEAKLLVDGKDAGLHEAMSLPAFSRSGDHVAYLYRDDPVGTVLRVDDEDRARYEAGTQPCAAWPGQGAGLAPYFAARWLSDDRLLVLTQDRLGWTVAIDGVPLASYEAVSGDAAQTAVPAECAAASRIFPASLTTADAAPVVLWWERMPGVAERWRIVRNGKPVDDVVCGGYWNTQPPVVTADGRHVAYVCSVAKGPVEAGVRVVHDGVTHGPYDDVWGFDVSTDGKHVAYGAARSAEGREAIYGAPSGPVEQPWRLYRDGEAMSAPQWSIWRPRFEPGSTRVAWEMQRERTGLGRIGIERMRLTWFDDILRGPEFGDGTIWWAIRRGSRVVRLELLR